jgi:hypothetical protein
MDGLQKCQGHPAIESRIDQEKGNGPARRHGRRPTAPPNFIEGPSHFSCAFFCSRSGAWQEQANDIIME